MRNREVRLGMFYAEQIEDTHLGLWVHWSRYKLSTSEKAPTRPLCSPTKIFLKLSQSSALYFRYHQFDSE